MHKKYSDIDYLIDKEFIDYLIDKEFKDAFIGWTVVSMGMTEKYFNDNYEGRVEGRLTFILKKDNQVKKVILGYTEIGEWVEAELSE